ncbi:MAG TPA: DUF456 domain-containing protein [Longimicrobiaceae bacterium]|nr:DUF456 domain-containing protein [Longimicrobiaceae bacterium]
MAYALLALSQVAGILLVPFGLPGTWVQVLGLTAYAWLTHFEHVGWPTIAFVVVLAVVAEVIEFMLGGRFAQKYGGSRRAGWGAILGGLVGALFGLPIPIVGSVVGAFLGAFAGAALFEMTKNPEWRPAMRVGWGAFLGRLAAVAVKSGIGVAIAVTSLLSALA